MENVQRMRKKKEEKNRLKRLNLKNMRAHGAFRIQFFLILLLNFIASEFENPFGNWHFNHRQWSITFFLFVSIMFVLFLASFHHFYFFVAIVFTFTKCGIMHKRVKIKEDNNQKEELEQFQGKQWIVTSLKLYGRWLRTLKMR